MRPSSEKNVNNYSVDFMFCLISFSKVFSSRVLTPSGAYTWQLQTSSLLYGPFLIAWVFSRPVIGLSSCWGGNVHECMWIVLIFSPNNMTHLLAGIFNVLLQRQDIIIYKLLKEGRYYLNDSHWPCNLEDSIFEDRREDASYRLCSSRTQVNESQVFTEKHSATYSQGLNSCHG